MRDRVVFDVKLSTNGAHWEKAARASTDMGDFLLRMIGATMKMRI